MIERSDAAGAAVSRVVAWCARYAAVVIAVWIAAAAMAAAFSATHFAIDTNTGELLSAELPWRQRQLALDKAFPQRADLLVIVIDARTPALASRAAARLAQRLGADSANFKAVWRPDGGDFFERNGLLFLPIPELTQTLERLVAAQPLLGPLAQEPSMRGLVAALALFARGATQGGADVDELERPLKALADTFEAAQGGRVDALKWDTLLTGQNDTRGLRRFVLTQPVLDYSALEPGERATGAVRSAAAALGITPAHGVTVRLTGQVPLSDEEFATIRDSAGTSAAVTVLLVLVLLWIALRSFSMIAAIVVSLFCGLAVTAALGLAMVGALNLISVAFAVLFVGLGVDFGIQLAIAYRAERHERDDLRVALARAGARVGRPLALAAGATAIGFFAFLPTAYRGVAELGLIAGVGMIVAFVASITMLPALLALLKPAAEAEPVGFEPLQRIDDFLARRSRAVVIGCAIAAAASLALLPLLRFDFNPLNLRSSEVESVATLLDLAKDPQTTPNTIDVLAPDLASAEALARKLSPLPQISQTLTLSSFVPEDQETKLAMIQDTAMLLGPALSPASPAAPGDAENVSAMREAARALDDLARTPSVKDTTRAQAKRLSATLATLAAAEPAARDRAHAALIPGLRDVLSQLQTALAAAPITIETLPPEIRRDWIAADGRARVEVYPAGDSTDNRVLDAFVRSVRAVAPEAVGAPVVMKESGNAIVTAFVQAGALALAAIVVLLAIVLRRVRDVLLTLAPLALSGLLTLALCVLFRRPLNYANIIALPLLFGIGVAFNIYFVMAWRAGERALLASSLARAVIFSALTTASAFGSLWLSSHPGTASMGELLALSLACTLACALLFLPALLARIGARE